VLHVEVLVSRHARVGRVTMNGEWDAQEKLLVFAIIVGLAVAFLIVPWLLDLGPGW